MKSKISEKEEELKVARKDEDEKYRTADKYVPLYVYVFHINAYYNYRLFTEANARLKKAIEAKNMQEIELAQAMLEGVSNIRKEQATLKRTVDKIQDSLDKKRDTLITTFFFLRNHESKVFVFTTVKPCIDDNCGFFFIINCYTLSKINIY